VSTAADPRVVRALEAQLERWREALASGARRIGWKIGLNIPEVQQRLGLTEPVVGHLTSATELPPGGSYPAGAAVELKAEPEMALELGRDVEASKGEDVALGALAAVGPAIELVDTGRPPGGLEAIVAENIFHRAFTLGPTSARPSTVGLTASVAVNGKVGASADVPGDFADVVLVVARLLEAAGERLLAGDRIIAGSLTPQVPVKTGDHVRMDAGELGHAELRIGP
jgi:2-keto-4-pentenoate hydratase